MRVYQYLFRILLVFRSLPTPQRERKQSTSAVVRHTPGVRLALALTDWAGRRARRSGARGLHWICTVSALGLHGVCSVPWVRTGFARNLFYKGSSTFYNRYCTIGRPHETAHIARPSLCPSVCYTRTSIPRAFRFGNQLGIVVLTTETVGQMFRTKLIKNGG